MSIANELSSDVAAAVLVRKETGNFTDSRELVAILLNFHSALRALTVEARRRRFLRPPIASEEPTPSSAKQASSGN